jgi:hypothetical protein
MTSEEETILKLNGWRKTLAPPEGYICRVCHHECFWESTVWMSPKYTFYHLRCIKESRQIIRLLKHKPKTYF